MTSARHIVEQLHGKWRGRRGMCKCPAHDDRLPSLSVQETGDGKPLVHCHAGCPQSVVLAALRDRGLWDTDVRAGLTRPVERDRDEDRERQEYARSLWDRGSPIEGTLAEIYLASRGIKIPPIGTPALRYLARLKHAPSSAEWPCMLAALTDQRGAISAVQRTWLAKDGKGKALVEQPKMTIGPMGATAVRLFEPVETLGLAEGIETALSATLLYALPTWAVCSANRFDLVAIPKHVTSLVLFGDKRGEGKKAIAGVRTFEAADHWEHKGVNVDVVLPGAQFGKDVGDFNDAVRGMS